MPTYRSITISLVSQFDILTIPEYAPPTTPTDPFSNAPTLVNPDHSLVSVYIPTYPSSQFWISYSISPPYPPKLLYYFKLYLNGNSVVSWGCGEDDAYRGKTMFGLFKPGHSSALARGTTLQQRVLCFGPDTAGLDNGALDNLSDVMEIKVFRSKGRKRVKPGFQTIQSVGISPNIDKKKSQQQAVGGINLVNAGTLLDNHPQRYYKYALLDPLDAPFATFRYYYRSWDQLEALGVISPHPSESSSITSIDSSPARSEQNLATTAERPRSPLNSSNTPESYVPVSASSDNTATNGSSHMAEEPKDSSTTEAGTATNLKKNSKATDDEVESQSTTKSPEESPLKIPFFLPRPPTPPPSSPPSKLAQLPNSVPPTTRDFNTLASKESFASLIRKRLPDPDPSAFQLTDPSPTVEPPNPTLPSPGKASGLGKRSGTGSMGVLMSVVNSAKNRRRREAAADSVAGEEEPSEGERTDGETGESISTGSGSEGSGKARGTSAGKKEKKRVKEQKRREEEEEEIGKQPEEKKRGERKRNLWEEL
ncbi:hypothetical protein HO173_004595 [Letharia columbiana]|uniref:Uncharacterized protein n=1 Tax=Letharia columbiana TaxID=112416 RepID=A0A8H6FYE3_9LECA|nr:uncharacterized protein HO173_004595 [Letharia columbiana]KAF6237127.1 hypothetical protein HO173_004595 [Letharia columbiana]